MNIILIVILLFCQFACAEPYQAEVENISNSDYFQPTLDALNNAKESIVMGMYIVTLPASGESRVKQLLEALTAAKKRGVKVKVIFEYHSLEDFTPSGLRYNAYQFLKDNGIDVYFDESPNNCLHLKTIVIDGEVVITGSSNWSEAAFATNYETNLIVRSKPLASEIIKDLEKIPLRKEPKKGIENSFSLPREFLSSSYGELRRMVNADDERAFDVTMILWGNACSTTACSTGNRMVHRGGVSAGATPAENHAHPRGETCFAEELGLSGRMDRVGWRRQIKKTLKKLEEKYKLIKYDWQYGKDEIKIELLLRPEEDAVKLPKEYFGFGWNRRLSFAGKAVLVTIYSELGDADGDVITGPILYLSKKYGMKIDTYSKGIGELKRFNIIKVEYAKGFKDREDTKINVIGLYDMEGFNKKIEELNRKYGGDLVGEAREFAGIVFCGYDLNVISDILNQIGVYGIIPVRKAFGYVKKMRMDNYKRTYGYVLKILPRN